MRTLYIVLITIGIILLIVGIVLAIVYSVHPTTTSVDVPQVETEEPVSEQPTAPLAKTDNVWVNEHNRIRADVGQAPIQWNQEIADRAQAHVDKCIDQHSSNKSREYKDTTLGENLAFGSPFASFSDADMVKMWEEEKDFYTHPEKPSESTKGETGHYTQIVNKNVTEIGCACSKCDGQDKLCACQYNPGQYGDEPPY